MVVSFSSSLSSMVDVFADEIIFEFATTLIHIGAYQLPLGSNSGIIIKGGLFHTGPGGNIVEINDSF